MINRVMRVIFPIALVISVVLLLGALIVPWSVILPSAVGTAVIAGLIFAAWHWGMDQVSNFLSGLWGILQKEPLKSFSVAILLTGVYVIVCWVLFGWLAGFLVEEIGASHRLAWLIVAVMGALIAPAIWHLYVAAGIPGKPEDVKKAGRIIVVPILILFAWVYWETPAHFFDHKTGVPLFWVAEEEGKIYFYPTPTEEELKEIEEDKKKELPIYYSKETGEKLRLGTTEDAKKYRGQILAVRLKEDLPSLADSLRILAPTASAETIKEVPAQSSRSFEVIAPPAPQWSRPLHQRDFVGAGSKTLAQSDSPRREYRFKTQNGLTGISKDGKSPGFDEWIGTQFQSTSDKAETIIITW